MSDLDKLIEAVEAGKLTKPGNEHWLASMPRNTWEPIVKASSGSLDAAKRLHEALLPGWEWWAQSLHYLEGDEGPTAILRTGTPGVDLQIASARSDNPARAWLLAVLRALRDKEAP